MGELIRLDGIAGGRSLLFCEFTLESNPIPKARARVGRKGTFTPPRTVEAQRELATMMLAHRQGPVARFADVRVELEFYLAGDRRRDVDNLAKLVLDAAIGVLYVDDAQVTQLEVAKFPAGDDAARTVVRVYRLDEADA